MTLTYDAAGVDYDRLDAFKRACQHAAAGTVDLLDRHGVTEPEGTRGESAYLLRLPDGSYLAHVEEGLGTKNLIADAMATLTGRSFYHGIGVDTVATIVNDLVTVGALPLAIAMHLAVGDSAWFDDADRAAALAGGFAKGCRRAGAVWGGGETPALKDVVRPEAAVIAGSAVGRIVDARHRITADGLTGGEAIVFLASTGVQTNGLTLCRTLAERLPEGYLTRLPDGQTFGEAVLTPSAIYVDFVTACQREGLTIRYAVHVTGHGWRKLMRPAKAFVYRIDDVDGGQSPPGVFAFLAEKGEIDAREMYGTFNMGVGFAAYVDPADADRAVGVATSCGHRAWVAGEVIDAGGRKAVEVPSRGLTYDGATLAVR